MGSTKERAAAIRKRLKDSGWNAKMVSVRCHHYSMGSSIYLTIRNPAVNAELAKQIAAEEGESIRRCEASGEILSGGNTFVHVDHTPEARAALQNRYLEAVRTAMTLVDADKAADLPYDRMHPIVVRPDAYVGKARGWGYSIWIDGGHLRDFDEAETGAMILATKDRDQRL